MSHGQTGFVPWTSPLCPRDKPSFSPYFAQWKPSLSQKQTQFVPGTIPRTKGTRKSLPFESKLLPAVFLFLRINFPKITVTVTVVSFGWFIKLPLPLPSWRAQSPLHLHWFPLSILKVIWINFPKITVTVIVLKCFWIRKVIILNMTVCVSGKKKGHKHKSFWPVTPPVTGGPPDREARGQRFMCYPRNPRNINLFVRIPDREDRWPGRPDIVLCAKVLCAFSAP